MRLIILTCALQSESVCVCGIEELKTNYNYFLLMVTNMNFMKRGEVQTNHNHKKNKVHYGAMKWIVVVVDKEITSNN